mgnify:CR=1 FL=1
MELNKVKFSVILPILERDDILIGFPKAIESIFENTIKPDQVLVIIDGLVSNSFRDLILNFQKKYLLDLIWTEKKIGLHNALNLGLSKCRNEIVFRADGDDINLKDRFELQIPYLLKGYNVVGSNIDEYDEDGNYISSKNVPINNNEIRKMITYRNPINHMTVGYLKNSVLDVGGYPQLFLKEDYGLWIKLLAKNKKFRNLEKSLVKATTGRRMIKDRSGIRYVYSEFLLQKFLLKYKLSKFFIAIAVFISRSIIFIIPSLLRFYFYKIFLREKKD